MEEIEYYLLFLKEKNIDAYNELNEKYNSIIYPNTINYIPPNIEDLKALLIKTKIELTVKNNNSNSLIEYLNINLENSFNNKINISLEDLDKINEMFLKSKEYYKVHDQRNILYKISLLYVMLVKQNIENVTIDSLKESYFNDNIKTVITCINILKDLNIVTNNFEFNSENIPTISDTLDVIRKMEFKTNIEENIKKLIK